MASNTLPSETSLDRLIERLDVVVREQVGESLADTMQRIRRLAIERRAGLPEAEDRLMDELTRLTPAEMRAVIRWLSLFFDLANVVEERRRVAVLRGRHEQAIADGIPKGESIAAAVAELQSQGLTASEMQRRLDRFVIEPVFTAHPSEAKRRTTRQLLRRIRQLLADISNGKRQAENELLASLTVLWQSDLVRPDRPPVMSEVSRGVYFAATLWDVVPQVYGEMREALQRAYPQHHFEIPPFLSFGTWIGGDRDGHPFVTAEITKKTFARLRRAAIEGHLSECRMLHNQMVVSDQQVPSDPQIKERLEDLCKRWPELEQRLAPVSHSETYRRFIRTLEFRLERTLGSIETPTQLDGAFDSIDEFQGDLQLLQRSVQENRGKRIDAQYLQPWIDLVNTFGFHFACLDIRQNSEAHRTCLLEVLALQGVETDGSDLEALLNRNERPGSIDVTKLTDASREVYETFLLLAEEHKTWGSAPVGGYIISMTHSAIDVMTVLWLWKTAWAQNANDSNDESKPPLIPIVPLFETIDDLRSASSILNSLLANPTYQDYLAANSSLEQMVMVGYSDSTKDGGYLSACWELHQAQVKLADVAQQHHVRLTVFHGRGGSLGRGGGPAARAIRSLPHKAVDGRLRVTEQGEVLSERYDDPLIAHRHLEQIINATLIVSEASDDSHAPTWDEAMDQLSKQSFGHYRRLVEHEGFLHYFDRATPISEIETLPIGSRPARRGQRRALSELRAIPWTFAWTQSRHLLPAWFGLGTAVRDYVDQNDSNWEVLRAMYASWPMFTAMIDNAELALAKADMQIARSYATLVSEESSMEVWKMISEEFDRSRGAILMIKEARELLADINWLRASVAERNPYVDPLNLCQIHLLGRLRSDDPESDLIDLARLSIQGIAAGLRTTG